jgi:hypothetical protein
MLGHVVFASHPLDPKQVDPSFEAEWSAAREAGMTTCLLDSAALDAGAFDRATRRVPSLDAPVDAVFRGWMMRPEEYGAMRSALAARGVRLVNDEAQYRRTHYLPEWYAKLRAHTPASVWTTTGARFELDEVLAMLEPFGDSPLILKDYVKSQKHRWDEACFIRSARDADAVRRVTTRFIELQGAQLVGGLVFREFVSLEPLAVHSKSKMPLTREFRVFVRDGRPWLSAPYWEEGDYRDEAIASELFASECATIDSNFFTMDVARRTDGRWIIMELGDAQVAGLPEALAPERFYRALASG